MNQESELRRTRVNRKKRRIKRSYYQMISLCIILLIGAVLYSQFGFEQTSTKEPKEEKERNETVKRNEQSEEEETEEPKDVAPDPEVKEPEPIVETQIKISAAGDFTLGSDEAFQYTGSFVEEASKNGLSHFVKGLNDIFIDDDLTTVNLETTLTTATKKANKKFRFRGDPSYAEILRLGGIEAVNLANNHIFDYLQQGYDDTISTLKQKEIGYFGYEHYYLEEIKGITIGAIGYEGWNDTPEIRSQVEADIKMLREKGAQIVLVHYHWGTERQYVPNEEQRSLARYTIDSGADLILGHHPHVIQGIEEYNGKFIVYSLGNFMFGGNRNPSDKDTYVFQQTFHFENGVVTDKKEINVVPFSISSVSHRNDYQPTLLEGTDSQRVMQKILDSSNQINGSAWLVYDKETE